MDEIPFWHLRPIAPHVQAARLCTMRRYGACAYGLHGSEVTPVLGYSLETPGIPANPLFFFGSKAMSDDS